jgi:hypothetical protein
MRLSSPTKTAKSSTLRTTPGRTRRTTSSRKLDYYDESDLINMFRRQIELERRLEDAKTVLAGRYDFNLFDMWSLWDDLGKGHLTAADVERQLNRLSIFPRRDEATLIVRHYAKGETRLTATGFNDLLLAKDPYYSNMLRTRPAERRVVLTYETERLLSDLLRTHIEAEELAESLRQRLSQSHSFNTYDAFKDIDIDNNGFITLDEFEKTLRNHNIAVSRADLNALMDIYDRRRDGRVSYTDFA